MRVQNFIQTPKLSGVSFDPPWGRQMCLPVQLLIHVPEELEGEGVDSRPPVVDGINLSVFVTDAPGQ